MNRSKRMEIYAKQSEVVLKNNNLLNKYKQAWIYTSFHRKSVRFLRNEIIFFTKNKAFQVEIMPISFLNDSETQDFGELKSKNFPKGEHAPDSPRSLYLWCLFRKLVSIYPRSVPDKVKVVLDQ